MNYATVTVISIVLCSVLDSLGDVVQLHPGGDIRTCEKGHSCIKKCCPERHGLQRKKCTPTESGLELRVFRGTEDISLSVNTTFLVFEELIGCEGGKVLRLSPAFSEEDRFFLQANGSLLKPNDEVSPEVLPEFYCLETFLSPNGAEVSALVCYGLQKLEVTAGGQYLVVVIVFTMLLWEVHTDSDGGRNLSEDEATEISECETGQCVQTCCVKREFAFGTNCTNVPDVLTDFLGANETFTNLGAVPCKCKETIWLSPGAMDLVKEDGLEVLRSLQLTLNYTQYCVDTVTFNGSLLVCVLEDASEHSTGTSFDSLKENCVGKNCVRKCCDLEQSVFDATCADTMPSNFSLSEIDLSEDTHFLIHSELECEDGYLKIKIDDFEPNEDGSIYWEEGGSIFGIDSYCLDKFSGSDELDYGNDDNGIAAFICVKDEEEIVDKQIHMTGCDERFCARKCCKMGYTLTNTKWCVRKNDTKTFTLPVYSRKTNFLMEIEGVDNFIVGVPECALFRMNNLDPKDAYYLQRDGALWVPGFGEFYTPHGYCIDEPDGQSAFVCFGTSWTVDYSQESNIVGMIISMPFLLLTFLVYAILPETSLHRKALMSYVLSLFAGYVFIVTTQLSGSFPIVLCHVMGYCIIFFFTVSFFWMNVMCIDMWLAFSGMRVYNGIRGSEKKRFIFYCLYAWGMPLVHVFIVFMLNTYGNKSSIYYPQLGMKRCFVEDGLPELLYFYLPMGIVIVINIVLFILTTVRIQQVKRETAVLKHAESKRHSYEDDKQKFNLYLKLMLAMGINWSMEIISWAVNWRLKNAPTWIWYLTDLTNATYGVVIFFIFVFKKKIWISLKKRYYVWIGKPHLAHTMSRSTQGTRTSNFSTTDTNNDYRMSNMRNGREEERALNKI